MNSKNDFWFHNSGYTPSVIVGLVALMLLIFVAWPNLTKIPETDAAIKETTAKVELLTREQQALAGFSDAQLDEISQKTDIGLPTEKSFPGLLSGLEFLASQANSQLISFDSSPGLLGATLSGVVNKSRIEDKLPAGMGSVDAAVGVNSNSANLIDLTNSLVKSGRLVTIESVSFDGQGNKGQQANTTIKIRVYYQPKPANPEDITKLSAITPEEKAMVDKVDSLNQFTLKSIPDLPTRPDPFAANSTQSVLPTPTPTGSPSSRP